MLLEFLDVHQFRNLCGKIFFSEGLNVLVGDNGQGKTNWLEAIYLLSTTKSFRTQRPLETVKFGECLSLVRGRVRRSNDIYRDLQVTLQGNTKILTVNERKCAIADYLDQLHVVAFTKDELEVVRGGPEARRRFLDRGIVPLNQTYIQTIADYQRVIKQKNRLLQDISERQFSLSRAKELISPWNEQLAELSKTIYYARTEYVSRLQKHLQSNLFGREEVTVRYVSSFEGKGDLKDYERLIRDRLDLRLQAEVAAGYSLIGPYRDDLEILSDGRDIRSFGSSGQQRSALILLDLATISVYYGWHNEYPLFLLDDVDAELDKKRTKQLFDYLKGRTQTFITTSKEEIIREFFPGRGVYQVLNGSIYENPRHCLIKQS